MWDVTLKPTRFCCTVTHHFEEFCFFLFYFTIDLKLYLHSYDYYYFLFFLPALDTSFSNSVKH